MKFSCSQASLVKAIAIADKAVSVRTTIPVLKGMLLTVKENKLIITTSDLDLSIETSIDVQAYEDGACVVNAKLFEEIIRKLPNSIINIGEEDGKLNITCLGSDFSIVSLNADDFPAIGSVNEDEKIKVEKKTFINLIKKTVFSAAIDEKKGVLTGCLVEFNEGYIELAALDGYRLAVSKAIAPTLVNKKMIVPARMLSEISKIISDSGSNEFISLVADQKRLEIISEDTRILARLLDGEFFKYKDIIPKVHTTRITFSKEEMLSAIERASLFANEGKNNLIKMDIKSGNIEITSRSEEGNVKENISAEIEGDDLVIGFNSKYVMDALKVIDDEEILFDMTSSTSASIIKPVEGDSFTYLVLPVRISG